jgi:ABC-type phosphate/phosphonate transport system substrate-binding protein
MTNQAFLKQRIVLIALGVTLVQSVWGEEPKPKNEGFVVRLALSSSVIEGDVNPDDAIAATKVWASTLGKGTGAWTKSDATIFRDINRMAASINNKEIDIAALAADEYIELESTLQADPALVYMQSGHVGVKYVLIVRRDSGFVTLADLRGKRVAVAKGGRNVIVPLWLDALMLDNGLPAKELFLKEIREVTKASQVVLPVFFKQIDAGVVIKSAFDTAIDLNPQIGRQVKIIATSERLIPQITCFRSSLSPETKTLFMKNALKLHEEPYGLQTFNVFKLERLLPWEPAYLDSVRDLIKKQKRALSTKGTQTSALQDAQR